MSRLYPGDWTRENYRSAVHQAFFVEKKKSISLDVEHAGWRNIKDIIAWAESDGYEAAENPRSETVRISLPDASEARGLRIGSGEGALDVSLSRSEDGKEWNLLFGKEGAFVSRSDLMKLSNMLRLAAQEP